MTKQNPHHERRWWILAVLCVAQSMVVLDVTVVNIALPSAQRDLGFSNSDRQWILTAYSLAFGSLLLLGGKLSDLFGRKRTLIIGLCGFALASAVGGAAQSFLMLAAARAVQGLFGALMAPAILSLVSTTFTEAAERNRAFGILGGVISSGASIGLLLGGALTQWIDWRAVLSGGRSRE
jgi:MFS family permease